MNMQFEFSLHKIGLHFEPNCGLLALKDPILSQVLGTFTFVDSHHQINIYFVFFFLKIPISAIQKSKEILGLTGIFFATGLRCPLADPCSVILDVMNNAKTQPSCYRGTSINNDSPSCYRGTSINNDSPNCYRETSTWS